MTEEVRDNKTVNSHDMKSSDEVPKTISIISPLRGSAESALLFRRFLTPRGSWGLEFVECSSQLYKDIQLYPFITVTYSDTL